MHQIFMLLKVGLTGESEAVLKTTNWNATDDKTLAENKHLVYSGTFVSNGKGFLYCWKCRKRNSNRQN